MGADFTFADFPYFDMTDDRRERFTELLNNLSPEQTAEFQDWFGLEDDDSFMLLAAGLSLSEAERRVAASRPGAGPQSGEQAAFIRRWAANSPIVDQH